MLLRYPFSGRWLVQNSPANRVPSHGTDAFASRYAVDFVPVDAAGRPARLTVAALIRPEAPDRFPGFGRPVLAPIEGVVVGAQESEPDHPAYRGIPSVRYALTQRERATHGWPALAGNHVLIRTDEGPVVALCHLQQHSLSVSVGQRVAAGEPVGRCGNSGNSTEPHLHLQAMDSLDISTAQPVPITFQGSLPRNRAIVTAL